MYQKVREEMPDFRLWPHNDLVNQNNDKITYLVSLFHLYFLLQLSLLILHLSILTLLPLPLSHFGSIEYSLSI